MNNSGIGGKLSSGAITFLLIMGLLCGSAWAAEQAGDITELEGVVQITRSEGDVDTAELNGAVYTGDVIQTSQNGRMTILFLDESVLTLGPDTRMKIDELVYQPESSFRSSVFSLFSGTIKGVVGGWFSDDEQEAKYEVRTPTAVAGVRGTGFMASVTTTAGGQTSTTFAGLSGGMIAVWALIDPSGRIYLEPNYFTVIVEGQLPSEPMIISGDMLRDLMESLIFTGMSLDSRAGQLFDSKGVRRTLVFLTPEALQGLLQLATSRNINEDDPSKLIFQDPPPLTPVVIVIGDGN